MADDRDNGPGSRKIRMEKNLASRMSNQRMARTVLDQRAVRMMDTMKEIITIYSGRHEANKVMKYCIKIIVKLGILYRNNVFSQEEINLAQQVDEKFSSTVREAIDSYEGRRPFDCPHLQSEFRQCHDLFQRLIERHLSQKSRDRAKHVFDLLSDTEFLQMVFSHSEPFNTLVNRLIQHMKLMIQLGWL